MQSFVQIALHNHQGLPIMFFSTVSSSSSINCPSLMSSWLGIIFSVDLSVISREFPSRFLKCSFHF